MLPAHPHRLQERDEGLVCLPPYFCQLHIELDDLAPTPGLKVHRQKKCFLDVEISKALNNTVHEYKKPPKKNMFGDMTNECF